MPMDDFHVSMSPIPRVSTTSEVARRLLQYVREAELGAGSRLPSERQIAGDLGVARSAVREALAALDLLGVIVSRQGSGNYLSDTPSELLPQAIEWGLMLGKQRTLDLAEARRHLEVTTARLAAERISPDGAKELETALHRMISARDEPNELTEADINFHMVIASLARNSVLSDILHNIQSLLRVWIGRGLTRDALHADATIAEHRAVCNAIVAGDVEEAGAAMAKHMQAASERLAGSLALES